MVELVVPLVEEGLSSVRRRNYLLLRMAVNVVALVLGRRLDVVGMKALVVLIVVRKSVSLIWPVVLIIEGLLQVYGALTIVFLHFIN